MTDTYIVDSKGRPVIFKDPDAVLDYSFDWTAYLLPDADSIATAQCIGVGVTVDSDQFVGEVVQAWVSGGVVGELATLTCRITTTKGRTDDRSVYLKIKER